MERVAGNDPASQDWKSRAQPLYQTRRMNFLLDIRTMEPTCENTCSSHSKLMDRMRAMEEAAKTSSDLKDAVKHLAENVAILHQTVVRMAAEQKEAVPKSVKVAVFIPSVLLSVASIVWMMERVVDMIK